MIRWLEKVNTEALLKAVRRNAERFLAYGSKRPKKLAKVAALRWPESGCRGFHGVREHHEGRSWDQARPFSTRCPQNLIRISQLLHNYGLLRLMATYYDSVRTINDAMRHTARSGKARRTKRTRCGMQANRRPHRGPN